MRRVTLQNVPALGQMANMLEGGGRTPLLGPAQLEALGYKVAAYPLSLLGVSIRAMQSALAGLKVLLALFLLHPRRGQAPTIRSPVPHWSP